MQTENVIDVIPERFTTTRIIPELTMPLDFLAPADIDNALRVLSMLRNACQQNPGHWQEFNGDGTCPDSRGVQCLWAAGAIAVMAQIDHQAGTVRTFAYLAR